MGSQRVRHDWASELNWTDDKSYEMLFSQFKNSQLSTISSSVNLFSFWLQSFPASGYFLMSWLFASSGQSMGASTSTSVLPVNIQDWFSLGLTGVIILLFKGLSRVFSNTTAQKHQFFGTQPSLLSNSYIHTWLLEKSQLWLYKSLSAKSSLCFLICFLDLS